MACGGPRHLLRAATAREDGDRARRDRAVDRALPHETNVYATYGSGLARSKARKIRAYAETLGVRWDSGASNLSEMRTPEGGGLLATGVGAGLTGQGANRIFIDDPYKNRIDAESAAYRQMLIDWFGDVAETRVEPGGSVFIFHTRWHVDDLIGHVLTGPDKRWVHRLMPALNDNGEALWPERWPAAALRQKELAVGPYTWASLYQDPRPRGGTVFVGVAFYHEAPKGYRVAIGVDLAYTAKTQADSSVAVVLAESEGKYYVLEVVRRQVKAPDFKNELLRLAQAYPGASMRIYGAGTEKGAIDLMRGDGVPLVQMPPKGDKFVRAQPAAAAWNSGDILVPAGENNRDVDPDEVLPNGKRRALRDAPAWVNDFVAEVAHFTGVNDKQDDQIDALAAAFDEPPAAPPPPTTSGSISPPASDAHPSLDALRQLVPLAWQGAPVLRRRAAVRDSVRARGGRLQRERHPRSPAPARRSHRLVRRDARQRAAWMHANDLRRGDRGRHGGGGCSGRRRRVVAQGRNRAGHHRDRDRQAGARCRVRRAGLGSPGEELAAERAPPLVGRRLPVGRLAGLLRRANARWGRAGGAPRRRSMGRV